MLTHIPKALKQRLGQLQGFHIGADPVTRRRQLLHYRRDRLAEAVVIHADLLSQIKCNMDSFVQGQGRILAGVVHCCYVVSAEGRA